MPPLVFIFICTTIAWAILGGTILSRTYSSDSRLKGSVANTWGAEQTQTPPSAAYFVEQLRQEEVTENGKKVTREVKVSEPVTLPLESSKIAVDLNLEHRQKGMLWYSTYVVAPRV